jgi:ribonucleoside-diphosphate reductase alpha chain
MPATEGGPEIRLGAPRRLEGIRSARIKGYEGDSCGECSNFTLILNDTSPNATPTT